MLQELINANASIAISTGIDCFTMKRDIMLKHEHPFKSDDMIATKRGQPFTVNCNSMLAKKIFIQCGIILW